MKIFVVVIMLISVLLFGVVSAYLGYSIIPVRCKIRELYYIAQSNRKTRIAQELCILLLVILLLECFLCIGTFPTL